MKVLKKVFTAIGHFFRNIWRYIMTNAWVQPILIVALIFAIIFGLTGIPSLIETVKGWFNDSTDNKIKRKYSETIDIDEFYELYEGNKSFVIVFGEDDCANCKTLYKKINTYMDDEAHRDNYAKTDIYFLNISDLLEDVNDDIEKYGDVKFATESDNFDKLERLGNILYNGFADVIKPITESDYSELQSYGKAKDAYGIVTPTTVFFTEDKTKGAENSKLFNIVVGQWDFGKSNTTSGYFGINDLFTYWHLSQEDGKWDEAITKRDALNQNHQG